MMLLRAFPRLHIGLLDLGGATHRRNGGAGFTLRGPCLELSVEPHEQLEITGEEQLDGRARADVHSALLSFQRISGPLRARFAIVRMLPQHVGLGSKTALLLTLLEAASRASGHRLDVRCLQLLTGRGGTSGVGINTFFLGGFVADGGHPAEDRPFVPSSMSRPDRVPPLLCRLDTPAGWRFSLVVARSGRISGELERRVFAENTPLPELEVLRALATMYHGIVPAVATADLALLGSALEELHGVGFKHRELQAQGPQVRDLYARIRRDTGAAVGLSSMGPLLYAISTAEDTDTPRAVEALAAGGGADFLGTFPPRNAGFEVDEGPRGS